MPWSTKWSLLFLDSWWVYAVISDARGSWLSSEIASKISFVAWLTYRAIIFVAPISRRMVSARNCWALCCAKRVQKVWIFAIPVAIILYHWSELGTFMVVCVPTIFVVRAFGFLQLLKQVFILINDVCERSDSIGAIKRIIRIKSLRLIRVPANRCFARFCWNRSPSCYWTLISFFIKTWFQIYLKHFSK